MNWFLRLFKAKKMEKEIQDLKQALSDCNGKLLEKQDNINQTNAYWKKKMYALKASINKPKE